MLRLAGNWYTVAKGLVKVGLSALYYYLGKAAGAPTVGVAASLGSFASLIQDVVQYFIKGTPSELGKLAGLQAAGVWAQAVGTPTPVTTPGEVVVSPTTTTVASKGRYTVIG